MGLVTFVDETTAGERRGSWGLEIAEERLALREVIRRRVFQEVAEYNASQHEVFRGLVQPTDAERRTMKRALWIFGIAFGLTIAWAAYAIYLPLFPPPRGRLITA